MLKHKQVTRGPWAAAAVAAVLLGAACSSSPTRAPAASQAHGLGASATRAGSSALPGRSAAAPPGPSHVVVSRVRSADGSVVTVATFRGPVRFVLHNGSADPGPGYVGLLHAGSVITGTERQYLLADFNGGFLLSSHSGGYVQILSPLIFSIALSALDEHLMAPWKPGGVMSTSGRRAARRRKGPPNWRFVRYADDFAVLVDGTRQDTEALRGQIAEVLATLGLRLSEAKTRVVHLSEGFPFLGFRIQWRRKRGTGKWYVYTFIDDRPIRSVKAKIRALTRRTSQQDLGYVLTRLNQVMHGWANHFRHAVAKSVFAMLDNFAWWRVIRMLRQRHRWRWKDVRRQYTTPDGRWLPITAGEIEMRRIAAIPVTRYRYRGTKIPGPWAAEPA